MATAVNDHYETYYADKLWALMPAVYRTQDTDQFDQDGPLRELVNRIGAAAAVLRRSIDRMWEDQSIETCDDWVIPYIADLLATRLVPNLDARGWRLDVANTIYYRRRKGTVEVLEEIAANITGWDAKVVEFFRRLGRTRHVLDPPIGLARAVGDDVDVLRMAEGLVGSRTRTGLGGLADLRDRYGATLSRSAFDEFGHTADVRLGRGNLGWHDIPRLGIFLWRLASFGVGPTTPVRFLDCPDWATFDPTGRSIPLFAAGRTSEAYGSRWVSPQPWQMPGPIDQPLLVTFFDDLYQTASDRNSLGVLVPDGADFTPVPLDPTTQIQGALGRFQYATSPPGGPVFTSYHYGFPSEIGAGPYDRRVLRLAALPTPDPLVRVGGGGALPTASPVGTLEIEDSLTYDDVPDVSIVQGLTIRASNLSRPLLRLPAEATSPPGSATAWTLTGAAGATLVLDGLFVSGGDIVLAGKFDTVVLSCCTLDPGSAGAAQDPPVAGLYATAADGRPLVPCTLWIEAAVRRMCVDRSVTGPIRTRADGNLDTLTVTDSILQAIPTGGTGPFAFADIKDPALLALRLRLRTDPLSLFLYDHLSPSTRILVDGSASSLDALPELTTALADDLSALVDGPLLYDPSLFKGIALTPATLAAARAAAASPPAGGLVGLNRRLLEEAYRNALGDAALAFTDGDTILSRCTVLGPVVAHRLHVNECLLDDVAHADDTQDGCVRFSAWSDGSVLPRKYESVRIAPGAAVFTSADFGRPGFAQLLPTADLAILPAPPGADPNSYATSIIEGSSDGSEMGAFARDKNPIKQRGLLLKYQEYMPVGLVPVVVLVT